MKLSAYNGRVICFKESLAVASTLTAALFVIIEETKKCFF